MKKTVYLSAFVFAAAISLIGCGDPLLDDLNSNIEGRAAPPRRWIRRPQ